MITISATDAENKIEELWDLADREPVTVERNGKPCYLLVSVDKYVVLPREEYERLYGMRPVLQMGFAKALFAGMDAQALLDVDLTEVMREYL